MIECVLKEKEILESAIETPIDVVSMHRPSPEILSQNIIIPGMINSYGQEFFQNFKYVSDSRRTWRENVEEIIESGEYTRLQILTHAFWYAEKEVSAHDTLLDFVKEAEWDRYHSLNDNIRELGEFITEQDLGRKN